MKQHRAFYTIILAQFCGTSLWFAANAVLPQLQQQFQWPAPVLGYMTSATQLGFITGTLSFALLGLADRFSPSKLFFVSSVFASLFNLLALADLSSYLLILVSRGFTGFFLAGIYPVGMKIAADWKQEGLGHWLGALVGALVLGTAFPHVLKSGSFFFQPERSLLTTSLLCILGSMLLLTLGDGPYRKKGSSFSFTGLGKLFKSPDFRSPAFGYFGHMWELYAFWTFVPWILVTYQNLYQYTFDAALFSAVVIGSGAIGCILGGVVSSKIGSMRVATYALACSGVCCLLSPFLWTLPLWLFMLFVVFWGVMVVADSPQFSALIAQNAPAEFRGSAITLATCIGFAITIVSIQLLNYFSNLLPKEYLLLLLLPGPGSQITRIGSRIMRIW